MPKFKFSIIMCTYNGGDRIIKVIDSVLNQDQYSEYVKEFIIIDNNSSAHTKSIINNKINKHKNMVSLIEERQGLSFARLKGVEYCTGEWIIFIDDDNILEKNWLDEAYHYIKNNSKIGAFNGAVVPYFEEKLSDKQTLILKNILQGIACTHLTESDINFAEKVHPYKIPFGAGLVIKSSPLKKLAKDGWIKNSGRDGKNLTSCEDSEICLFIKRYGYKFGYNPNMKIIHLIDKSRLEWGYLEKLWKGFADGNYNIIRNGRFRYLKLFIYVIILHYRMIRDYIKVKLNPEYEVKKNLNKIYRKRFLINIKNH